MGLVGGGRRRGKNKKKDRNNKRKKVKGYYQSVRGINEELMVSGEGVGELHVCFLATNFIYAPPPPS